MPVPEAPTKGGAFPVPVEDDYSIGKRREQLTREIGDPEIQGDRLTDLPPGSSTLLNLPPSSRWCSNELSLSG